MTTGELDPSMSRGNFDAAAEQRLIDFEADSHARHNMKYKELEAQQEQRYRLLKDSLTKQREQAEIEALSRESEMKRQAIEDEERLRQEYEEKIKLQQKLHGAEMDKLAEIQAKDRAQRELAMIEFEENTRRKYDDILRAQEGKHRDEMSTCKQSLDEERAALQDDLRNRLAAMQAETGAYEEGVRERYSAMVADANQQSCKVIAGREAKDREEWTRREKELSDRARELELQHVAYEDQLRQQFADLLKRAEENHRESTRKLEASMAEERKQDSAAAMEKELQLQKQQLDNEREIWAKYEVMQKEFEDEMQQQMTTLRENLATEKERMARQQLELKHQAEIDRTAFEASVREEYDKRMYEFLEMERRSWDEKDKLARGARENEDAEKREEYRQQEIRNLNFEKECREKYLALLKKEQDHWKVLDTERASQVQQHISNVEKEFQNRQEQLNIEKLQYEKRVQDDFKNREMGIKDVHLHEIRTLQEELDAARMVSNRKQREDNSEAAAKNQEYATKLRATAEAEIKACEERLRREHLERESTLIAECEQLKAEMREREHNMSLAILKKEDEARAKCSEMLDRERANMAEEFQAQAFQLGLEAEKNSQTESRASAFDADNQRQAIEAQVRQQFMNQLEMMEKRVACAETEANAWRQHTTRAQAELDIERASKPQMDESARVRAVQSMMEKAMAKEKAELKAEYELKLSQALTQPGYM